METKETKANVLKTFLDGRFSPGTERKVQRWIVDQESVPEVEKASLQYWEELDAAPDGSVKKHWKRVAFRVGIGQERGGLPLRRRLLRVAAILLPLLLLGGGYFYSLLRANDMQEVCVAYGEQQHLFLPDSSEVWINAGSVLRFPAKFEAGKRNVSLEGEAFFSVRHDASRPFEVQTRKLSVRVLGTRFNVKDYAGEEHASAMLESGKVAVQAGGQSRKVLSPNQQLTFDSGSSEISITEVSPQEATAWTAGQLIFRDASLQEILRVVERKFGVSFQSGTSLLQWQESYTVRFIQNESLNTVLDVLGDMAGFSYSRRGDMVELKQIAK